MLEETSPSRALSEEQNKPRGRRRRYTQADVLKAVEEGVTVKGVALILKCSRQTVYRYLERWPAVRELLEQKRADLVDLAETGLYRAVLSEQPWAIMFTLKTLGRDRGYSERHEFVTPSETVLELVTRIVRVEEDSQTGG